MEQINQYTILQELKSFDKQIKLWYCKDPNTGKKYELLTIKNEEAYASMVNRILSYEVKLLINKEINGIQVVREVGLNETASHYFIVYDCDESYDFLNSRREVVNVQTIIDVVDGLNRLQKDNLETYVIAPNCIQVDLKGHGKLCFLGLFELFAYQGLLTPHYLPPNVVLWLDKNQTSKPPRPNFQDDIYALIKTFSFVLNDLKKYTAAVDLLTKGLNPQRTARFARYSTVLNLLGRLPIRTPEGEKRNAFKVVVNPKRIDTSTLRLLLNDMSNGVWFDLSARRSNKGNLEGAFSTINWNGKFVVNQNNSLFVPHCNQEPNEQVLNSSTAFRVDASFGEYASNFKCIPFFTQHFETKNKLAVVHKVQRKLVREWSVLPQKEQAVVEAAAIKITYYQREEDLKGNILFYLKDDEELHWDKVRQLKRERVMLFVANQVIGSIVNYNVQQKILILGDVKCEALEIPKQGVLMQDVRQETSQFRKQVEACQQFEQSTIVNPTLCSILATPDTALLPKIRGFFKTEYESFKKRVFNPQLAMDSTQLEAVMQAMSRKPLYLIQGPPGTGKTTVIVELIQQILSREKRAKILITSQSNLAVDNVLERIANVNQTSDEELSFVRLASEYSLEKDNISSEILPHTFERKLKHWAKNTEQKSVDYFQQVFTKQDKQKELIQLYEKYCHLKGKKGWKTFTQKLKIRSGYVKQLFEQANGLSEAKRVFEEFLGADFLKLKNIQQDWLAFLGGVTIDAGEAAKQSMLNDGSKEIDFLTAMMQEINIVGATCIHIASGKYSRINFQFDYVIMDESSKASPPETLVPINMGRNIILIGDHKQLPPVVTRDKAVRKGVEEELEDNGLDFHKTFGKSLFETLVNSFEKDVQKQQYIKMLDIQYRMPKQIGALISRFFYDGKLRNPSFSIEKDKAHGLPFKKDTSMLFISTSNRENPSDNGQKLLRNNSCNLDLIRETLEQLNSLYSRNLEREKPFTIGIIAGYRGQVNLLNKELDLSLFNNFIKETEVGKEELISINTVDKFQGAERDIIIYDVVRSSTSNQDIIGFLDDYRRINVAFSRVKRLLIVVGDSEYLRHRAVLHPESNFKEFKLQQITEEFYQKGLIYDNLSDILKSS